MYEPVEERVFNGNDTAHSLTTFPPAVASGRVKKLLKTVGPLQGMQELVDYGVNVNGVTLKICGYCYTYGTDHNTKIYSECRCNLG